MFENVIDLNADAGESFGAWRMGRDEELYPVVTSVNLACGFHAGDPSTMLQAIRLAKRHGTAVGAHPGHPDLVGFGRRQLMVEAEHTYADVLYQIGALAALAGAEETRLHHVKAHGALYLQMLRDEGLARAVAAAVRAFDPELPLVVLAGTLMQRFAEAEGTRLVQEAFPDRGYLASGALAPRGMPGALVREPGVAADRAVRMAQGVPIETLDGGSLVLDPETLCIHGDNPEAVMIARAVREALEASGIEVRAY